MKKQSTYYTAGTSDASCHLVLTTTQRNLDIAFTIQFTKGKVKAQKVRCSPQATDQEGKALGANPGPPHPSTHDCATKPFTYPPNSDAN